MSDEIDYTARDYQRLLDAMRARIPDRLGEWTDYANEADFGNVLLELFAYMGDILSYYQDRVANESFLGTARTRAAVIQHLRLIGYELGTAVPAAATLLVSVPGNVEGAITVTRGNAFSTKSRRGAPSVRFEYTGQAPLTIDFATVEPDPETGRKVVEKGIPVEEGRLIEGEALGSSDGRADQRFPLGHTGVILWPGATADVQITAEPPQLAWERRDSLALSRGGQPHFVVEVDADDHATVVFGDGVFGRIPTGRLRATYRVGGGPAGNVGAREISTILDCPPLAQLGATVSNQDAGTGGAAREDPAHAVRQAPAVFRSQHRAVTAADYEALALSFKGVGKVRATAGVWNDITLHVAPEGGGHVSDVLRSGLLSYLEDKRMLGQIVGVEGVLYIPVLLTAEIGVEPRYPRDDVQERVRQTTRALLAFDRTDFGQTVYLSRFYEEIQNTPGVRYANITEFRRGPADPVFKPSGKLEFEQFELPVPADDSEHPGGIALSVIDRGRR
ncbi:baseplate J/gp47 family protein [Streptomyces sp. NPDC002935]|uniref:baseplate J/gp47 family protein n=1 Tax=Streptomyces sp. NPDC002935 TaxID=3154545 RepID=UPI00339E1F3F